MKLRIVASVGLSLALVGCFDSGNGSSKSKPQAAAPEATSTPAPKIEDAKQKDAFTNPDKSDKEKALVAAHLRCAEEVCQSDFKVLQPSFNLAKAGTPEQHSYFKKNLEPIINQNHTGVNARLDSFLSRLNRVMNKELLQSLSSNQKKLVSLQFTMSNLELSNPEQLKALEALFNSIPEFLSFQEVRTMGLRDYLDQRQIKMNSHEYLNSLIDVTRKSEKEIAENLQVDWLALNEEFYEAIRHKDASIAVQQEFLEHHLGVMGVHKLLFSKLPPEFEKLLIPFDSIDTSKLLNTKKLEKTFKDHKQIMNNDLKSCEDRFIKFINLTPTQKELSAFEEKLKTVQAAASLLAQSESTRKTIQNAKVWLPSSYEVALKESIEFWTLAQSRQAYYSKQLGSASDANLLLYFLMDPSPSNEICSSYFEILSDKTLPRKGRIKVSSTSVKLGRWGLAVAAHEFAHNLDADTSIGDQYKACVASSQGTKNTADEDFADRYSEIILEKAGIAKDVNLGCLIIASDDTHENLPIFRDNKTSSHSPGLARAIAISGWRGNSIPQTCTEAAKMHAPEALKKLNKCE